MGGGLRSAICELWPSNLSPWQELFGRQKRKWCVATGFPLIQISQCLSADDGVFSDSNCKCQLGADKRRSLGARRGKKIGIAIKWCHRAPVSSKRLATSGSCRICPWFPRFSRQTVIFLASLLVSWARWSEVPTRSVHCIVGRTRIARFVHLDLLCFLVRLAILAMLFLTGKQPHC